LIVPQGTYQEAVMILSHLPPSVPHVHVVHIARLSVAQITEARAWLCDCTWADVNDSDIMAMSAERIERAIQSHYEGGMDAFILDGRIGFLP
jgi:hypothetical protein